MYAGIFQEKRFNAEVKTFYVSPPRDERKMKGRNVCCAKLITVTDFLRLYDDCVSFVPRSLIPLDYITKLELLLIALHREGQILWRFYLCGMMNWAAELFLLHFNFPHLSQAQALESPHREFFLLLNRKSWRWKSFLIKILPCTFEFEFQSTSRREKVASDLLDELLITELVLQINFHSQNLAADDERALSFPTRDFPTHEIEYGVDFLSPASKSSCRERYKRDAINVETDTNR